jgi:hypothetical protein
MIIFCSFDEPTLVFSSKIYLWIKIPFNIFYFTQIETISQVWICALVLLHPNFSFWLPFKSGLQPSTSVANIYLLIMILRLFAYNKYDIFWGDGWHGTWMWRSDILERDRNSVETALKHIYLFLNDFLCCLFVLADHKVDSGLWHGIFS